MTFKCLSGTSAFSVAAALMLSSCVMDEGGDSFESDLADTSQQVSQNLVNQVRYQISVHDIQPTAAAPAVSDEMFELGRALSFDKILSGNRNISCLSCHHPILGSDDDRHLPLGEGGSGLGPGRVGGPIIPRNAPALFNLHAFDTMFWDSRVEPDGNGGFITPAGAQLTPAMTATLSFGLTAAQALFPVTSREEMRGHAGDNELANIADNDFQGIWSGLMGRLGAIPQYVTMFEAAYPGENFADMTFAHAANAIAGFEIRGFESVDSPWEQFLRGDDSALSNVELLGAKRFFDAGCASCHNGPQLSDFRHHNTGMAQFGPGKGSGPTGTDDFGREQATGNSADRYRFRTPPLSNIELTGPYGHDGQFAELRAQVRHYVDVESSLQNYDITDHVSETALHSMQLDNTADVLATISPAATSLSMNNGGAVLMTKFLKSLTDDNARDLAHLVPASVPSGLPVAD